MDPEIPLLSRTPTVLGAVDHRGLPAPRSATGGWSSALFIIGVEIAERFAFYGMSTNLITYLTGTLGQSTANAAANVNAWSGTASMLPLLGGILADSWLGRYPTIIGASLLYILGLGLLSLSASAPWLQPKCETGGACSPTDFQIGFFFASLYLVSIAQGGHKPCVQAFGADQFDENDPVECKARSSFFNWWYFAMCGGIVITIISLSYVQDNISWGLGFGIPCLAMVLALIVFLIGRSSYRYHIRPPKNLIARSSSLQGQQEESSLTESAINIEHQKTDSKLSNVLISSEIVKICKANYSQNEGNVAAVLRLFPIWATCLAYAVVFAQSSTFFVKQGSTMDRRVGPKFKVPPAALQSFISLSVVIFIPVYDRVVIPIARTYTGLPSGITMLQRIGMGMFLSMISMIVSALVEEKRLQTAKDFGLVDDPNAMIPMTLWWLLPQYVLFGISDVFTMVGLQEFFYDQVPNGLRSLGLALYMSIFGIGSFISSFLVSIIDNISKRYGESWFSNNLNRGHLNYFYWVLAGLSAFELLVYLYFSKIYNYKKETLT